MPRLIRSSDVKPRLLLVDDHRGVLARVSAMLEDDFEIAAIATDGPQALDTARRIDPDAIVLDINMPGLDGFRTMQALASEGSKAPVVFLSTLDSAEHVGEAFRRGGRGYVLKSRAAIDLPGAIDQVLVGRAFVPSLTSLLNVVGGSGHAMQLYKDLETFLDGVAAFFDTALRRGDATCVIATEELRDGLGGRLRARGWSIGGSSAHPRYLAVDARDALRGFMRDGLPDRAALEKMVNETDDYRRRVAGEGSRATIFGNMAGVLSEEGNVEGAMALERLWNEVAGGRPFLTVCGYATSCFQDQTADFWSRVCAEHEMVSQTGDV